ncbi:MAG: aminomethyl-transferring glycine dehydrogenase subunit GcvPA [Chloroflexota bacterium]|nr:MAG: aminomethyl-transferring glycine dehydrogenase subunit GcvPA [Chloroflexota bacterium]
MTYVPNTDADRAAMIDTIGVSSIDALFANVPRQSGAAALNLPLPMAEAEAARHMRQLAAKNANVQDAVSFLGAGGYRHHIPSLVGHITGRGEFYTAYTPYQPEVSQGTLQTIYEYQSMVAELTGMDVANASMYDGSSALGESILMAAAVTHRKRVVIADSVHPQYRQVGATYASGPGIDIREIAAPRERRFDGRLPRHLAQARLDDSCAALIVQQPNFFGGIEDIAALAEAAHAIGALLIVAANPIALGLLASPGSQGADIVVGEGQPLGIPLSFGGPWLGIFSAKNDYVRQMPGRIVGVTNDIEGKRGLVLTLQTREQHIRRERATSNICTNQALCALASTVYLETLGRNGLRAVAEQCVRNAHAAASRIGTIPGFTIANQGPYFHEFVVRCPAPAKDVCAAMHGRGVLAGYPLGDSYADLADCLLVCATEVNTAADIARLVDGFDEIGKEAARA